jgi:hypothetical protein
VPISFAHSKHNKLVLELAALLFLSLVVLLVFGCASRHLPSGATAPATKFEQLLVWNTALAQANDSVAQNIVALQQAGVISVPQAKIILLKQGAIAQADQRITARIQTAATCGQQQAGATATAAQLDAAAAACAKAAGGGSQLGADLNLIPQFVADLNNATLLGIKDPAKQKTITDLLTAIQTIVKQIFDSLHSLGVVARLEEVHSWLLS